MEEILQQARRLGKAIHDSPQARALREAQKAFDADPDAGKLFEEAREQMDKVRRLEEANAPIEVADKHRMEDLQNRLAASETFKRYSSAQVNYLDLMRKVDQAMREQLGPAEGPGESDG